MVKTKKCNSYLCNEKGEYVSRGSGSYFCKPHMERLKKTGNYPDGYFVHESQYSNKRDIKKTDRAISELEEIMEDDD